MASSAGKEKGIVEEKMTKGDKVEEKGKGDQTVVKNVSKRDKVDEKEKGHQDVREHASKGQESKEKRKEEEQRKHKEDREAEEKGKEKEHTKSGKKLKERVVIIAMDGSESSVHAFNTYVDLLRREGDRAVLFTCKELKEVLHSTLFATEAILTYDPELLRGKLGKEKEVAKAFLQPYVDQLTQLGVKVKPAMLVCQDAGHSIVGMAEHEEAHLIVMGCRGHGKLRRTLIGSCSDYVINHAHVPVVVCRH